MFPEHQDRATKGGLEVRQLAPIASVAAAAVRAVREAMAPLLSAAMAAMALHHQSLDHPSPTAAAAAAVLPRQEQPLELAAQVAVVPQGLVLAMAQPEPMA
jgi:hypothetical protein